MSNGFDGPSYFNGSNAIIFQGHFLSLPLIITSGVSIFRRSAIMYILNLSGRSTLMMCEISNDLKCGLFILVSAVHICFEIEWFFDLVFLLHYFPFVLLWLHLFIYLFLVLVFLTLSTHVSEMFSSKHILSTHVQCDNFRTVTINFCSVHVRADCSEIFDSIFLCSADSTWHMHDF